MYLSMWLKFQFSVLPTGHRSYSVGFLSVCVLYVANLGIKCTCLICYIVTSAYRLLQLLMVNTKNG